jgi:hypothetical protein
MATGIFGSLGSFFAKVGSKAKNVVKGGNKDIRLAQQNDKAGLTNAKNYTGSLGDGVIVSKNGKDFTKGGKLTDAMGNPLSKAALDLRRYQGLRRASSVNADNKAWMKAYEQSQRSLAAKVGRGISSNAGLMWGSSIAGGLLMMVPFFVALNKKKVEQDPAGAADDMFGLSDYIGADLAALAPMLISALPVSLICCCCCFMMMMMMSMGGGGASGNS